MSQDFIHNPLPEGELHPREVIMCFFTVPTKKIKGTITPLFSFEGNLIKYSRLRYAYNETHTQATVYVLVEGAQ